jgi:kynurenine formamidase
MNDDDLVSLFRVCSNSGRWGAADERGTLNLITPHKRRAAASLVKLGRSVSIARVWSTPLGPRNGHPVDHLVLDHDDPDTALDYVGLEPHGYTDTHLDALSHCFWEGSAYNGRSSRDVVHPGGLSAGSIDALREGIFTRGVLLDVAGARGQEWLEVEEFVTIADLEAAEELGGLRVESGDAIFVHVGLEAREAQQGPEDVSHRAGLHAEVLPWLHDRDVAVYSGDCVERIPYPSPRVPLPLHQIGLVAMGLVLLDCPLMAGLVHTCRELERYEFLLSAAPLPIPGGTGSPVNPICTF